MKVVDSDQDGTKAIQNFSESTNHVQFEGFWLEKGDQPVSQDVHYIITPSIKKQLISLSRIVASSIRYPVLLQGPTSSGKTSMVSYLAKMTGHRCVRINNHEHTDLQEYLGQYVSDDSGKLSFVEGILVEAVRKGYWIVLDELNLAPSEVLEALNRLLDDNRELFIPETQQLVKAHPHFMLFATQNPPGLYGGRKALSRAFRNRFVELHFDDIPDNELEQILHERCAIPPKWATWLVNIMKELQRRRQNSRVFAGKHGFITLRDLFRWADRRPANPQDLACQGYFFCNLVFSLLLFANFIFRYMLLAERLRSDEEREIVENVLEKHLKVKLDMIQFYNQQTQKIIDSNPTLAATFGQKIVWTSSMKRLFTLVGECLRYKEPCLIVGDTGTGKTTVCQLHAHLAQQHLHILNCHQNSETGRKTTQAQFQFSFTYFCLQPTFWEVCVQFVEKM
jgi:midasin